jgi:hypothetical protein
MQKSVLQYNVVALFENNLLILLGVCFIVNNWIRII